jgi:hypothetical protein
MIYKSAGQDEQKGYGNSHASKCVPGNFQCEGEDLSLPKTDWEQSKHQRALQYGCIALLSMTRPKMSLYRSEESRVWMLVVPLLLQG